MAIAPEAAETAALEQDLGPLAWVEAELRRSIDAALKSLRRHLREADRPTDPEAEPGDPTLLRTARQQLHQASGALQMVGMESVAQLVRAMEAAVQRFATQPALCDEAAVSVVERAAFALGEYLDALLAGKHYSAVGLFPQYRELQALAGADRAHPADLWTGGLSEYPPLPVGEALPLAYGQAARSQFDQKVLSVVKTGDPVAARKLAALSQRLAVAQSPGMARTFWQVCAGFFEAQALDLLPHDLHAKRVASRVLMQYTAMARGENDVKPQLLQDLLFFCAHARPAAPGTAPALDAVRQAWGLDHTEPVDYDRRRFGRFDPNVLAQARKRIATAAETWSALAGGDRQKIKTAADQFGLVADSLRRLHTQSTALADSLTQALDSTVRSGEPPGTALAMEVATSVLYLQAAYEELDTTDEVMAERARVLAGRLDRAGSSTVPEPLAGWMEDLYRRVSDRQTMGSVVEELRATLREAEQALDAFFRAPHDAAPLVPVPGHFAQMRGVLSVLGLDQASHAVVSMRDSVERLLLGQPATQAERVLVFDALAGSLGALGFLIDMLGYQPTLARRLFVFDEQQGILRVVMDRAPAKAPVAEPAAPADASPATEAQAEAEAQPAPPPADDMELRLAQIADTAAVAAPPPAEQPRAAEPPPSAPLAQAVAAPAPAAAPAVSTAAEEDADDDFDLRDVFLDEAREVIVNGNASLAALDADPGDLSEQTTLRRAFHTLKGSARMVGLDRFGEAAWAMEQMFNAWLAEQQPMPAPQRALATEALGAFGRWVEDVAAHTDEAWDPAPFRAAADALRLGETPVALRVPGASDVPNAEVPAAAQPAAEEPAVQETVAEAPVAEIPEPAPEADPTDEELLAAFDAEALEHLDFAATIPFEESELPREHLLEAGDSIGFGLDLPESPASAEPSTPATLDMDIGELDFSAFANAVAAEDAVVAEPQAARSVPVDLPVEPLDAVAAPAFLPAAMPLDESLDAPESAQEPTALAGEPESDPETDTLPPEAAVFSDLPLDAEAPAGLAIADETPAEPVAAETPVEEFTAMAEAMPELVDEPEETTADATSPEAAADPFAELADLPVEDAVMEPAALEAAFEEAEAEALAEAPEQAALLAADEAPDMSESALSLPEEREAASEPMPIPADAVTELADEDIEGLDLAFAPAVEAAAPEETPAPAPAPQFGSGLLGDAADDMKAIGTLRIPIPLYNVYLNEADEWSRRLLTELSEWALELHRSVPDAAVALAHSLAGSSATVGFEELSGLARLLEQALQHVQRQPGGTPHQAGVFVDTAEDIRRLLHQFAAGFLKEPTPRLLRALQVLIDTEPEEAETPSAAQFLRAADEPVPFESGKADSVLPEEEMLEEQEALDEAQPVEAPGAAEEPVEEEWVTDDRAETAAAEAAAAAEADPVVDEALIDDAIARALAAGSHLGDDIDAVDNVDIDLFPIFEEEALELLPQLGGALRRWVLKPDNAGARSEILRVLHTLKGSARLAGALRLGELAHRFETAIEDLGHDALQTAELEPLFAHADALQANFDALRATDAQAVADGGAALASEPEPGDAALELASDAADDDAAAGTGEITDTPSDPAAAAAEPAAGAAPVPVPRGVVVPFRAPLAMPSRTAGGSVRVRARLLDRLVNEAGEVMISRSRLEARLVQMQSSLVDLNGNLDRLRRQLRDIEVQAESQMQSRLAKDNAAGFDPLEFDRFTRVQELTRMMAESVDDVATVQRNLQRGMQGAEDDLVAQGRQARELQRDLLRTRMVEFEGIADRLYAVARQAAKETGKPITLDITGGNVEMDRGVLERLVPPFEHLLRNAVVHGIESPDARQAAGKPATGTIAIAVHQDGNDVAIEFRDDGAGLNLDRIREKGRALGLILPDATPSDEALADLIFAPGFSTANELTELAGRGIGMDVVRSEVQAAGGRIETHTTTGQGTRFELILPLTTAVTQVLLLRAGGLTVGVPATVVEVVRRASQADIDAAYASGTFLHAGENVPFFWSGALLQASAVSHEPQTRTRPVVVFRSAQQRVALHVDEVLGQQEVVVKNLGPQLARLPGLSAMTVLPSGAVVLVYNPVALANVYGERIRAVMASIPRSGTSAADSGAAMIGAGLLPPVDTGAALPLVLVVDDSITVRRVTQRLLRREGYRVALAADGLQALERLREERPAMVLSDIEMPRMDGFDLLRNMRADATLADLPVVMITSRIAAKHREYAMSLGANHYLGKPYPEDELLALVRRYTTVETPVA